MRTPIAFALLLILSLTFGNCEKAPETTCSATSYTFVTDVSGIMGNCAYSGCHDGNNQPDYSGRIAPFNFNNYEDVRHVVENGQFVRYVFHHKGDSLLGMPPRYAGGPLGDYDYDVLRCWIEQGYPEN
jgi:hypothetical protein